MIRVVVSNQRGGVGKTTTAITLSRFLAEQGRRVLLVDTDPQGSIAIALGLRATGFLAQFVGQRYTLKDCISKAHPLIDVICGSRETTQAEAMLLGSVGREHAFVHLFRPVEHDYDAIIFDVAPSVTLLQTCALVYAQHALIPVDMDMLSYHGAVATYELTRILHDIIHAKVQVDALLPTQVNQRLQMTRIIMESLEAFSGESRIPLLNQIGTDATIAKSTRNRKFLMDFAPDCNAMQNYRVAFERYLSLIEEPMYAPATA